MPEKSYKKPRPFVGMLKRKGPMGIKRETFWCSSKATQASHGHRYDLVVGPFRTTRGAAWCARYGLHELWQTVSQIEAAAKLAEETLRGVNNSKGVKELSYGNIH